MVRRLVLVVAFALGAGLVGCGSEDSTSNDLVSVDTVPPAAIANLEVHVNVTDNPSVQLSWSPGFEADLAGYRVYRYEPTDGAEPPKRGQAVVEAMQVRDEVTNPSFVDHDVVAGGVYTYAISAFDVAQNESPRVQKQVLIAPPTPRTAPEDLTF